MTKGTITPLPSGSFRLRFFADGKRHSHTFATEEEAKRYQASIAVVLTPLQRDETVADAVNEWVTRRENLGTISDARRDRGRFTNHIASHSIASLPLRAVRRAHVADWLEELEARVSRQTAANALLVLRGGLQRAAELGKIPTNPAAGVRPRKARRTVEPWTFLRIEEQETFVGSFPEYLRPFLRFAMWTGLRSGELQALRIADVGETSVVVRYGSAPAKPTKNGKIRTVPLFPPARAAWKEWLANLATYAPENPHGLAFPRPGGGFRARERLFGHRHEWKRATAALGRRFRQHDLRHTWASSLVSGVWGHTWTTDRLRAVGGWATTAMVERYAHLAPSAIAEDVEKTSIALVTRGTKDTPGHETKKARTLRPFGARSESRFPSAPLENHSGNQERVQDVASWALEVTEALAAEDGTRADEILARFVAELEGPHRHRFAVRLAGALLVSPAVATGEAEGVG